MDRDPRANPRTWRVARARRPCAWRLPRGPPGAERPRPTRARTPPPRSAALGLRRGRRSSPPSRRGSRGPGALGPDLTVRGRHEGGPQERELATLPGRRAPDRTGAWRQRQLGVEPGTGGRERADDDSLRRSPSFSMRYRSVPRGIWRRTAARAMFQSVSRSASRRCSRSAVPIASLRGIGRTLAGAVTPCPGSHGKPQGVSGDERHLAEESDALHQVRQLPDIARPAIGEERDPSVGRRGSSTPDRSQRTLARGSAQPGGVCPTPAPRARGAAR